MGQILSGYYVYMLSILVVYIALAKHVLGKAVDNGGSTESIRPEQVIIPSIKGRGRQLLHLKLNKSALNSPDLMHIIKSAFRRQAIKNHPDVGGTDDAFRQIHRAYQELTKWAENPSFKKRSGFPDKWFYDGCKNRWVQPTPESGTQV